MEQRQTQVQVGAGLQESRLNTDLINFLQKYGSWAVYALLVVVLGYIGWDKWKVHQEGVRDEAFADYRAASTSSNPASLIDAATKHAGTTVAAMSRIEAVRLYVDGARRGLKPGADPLKPVPEDKLDEAGKRTMVADANKLIDEILADRSAPAALAQQALWFRAGIQADSGDVDAAVATMKTLEEKAKALGFADQEAKARDRVAHLTKLKALKPLFAKADLPESAREPVAPPPQVPGTPTIPGMEVSTSAADPNAMPDPILTNAPKGVEIKKLTPAEIEEALKGRKLSVPPQSAPPADPAAPAPAPAADPKPN
jgi:hypothetical protein